MTGQGKGKQETGAVNQNFGLLIARKPQGHLLLPPTLKNNNLGLAIGHVLDPRLPFCKKAGNEGPRKR